MFLWGWVYVFVRSLSLQSSFLDSFTSTDTTPPSLLKRMHRLIGKKAPEVPAPTLGDATKTLEARADTLDQRILKLDKELAVYKKQLKTAKGTAQAALKQRALGVLKRKKMLEKQRDGASQQAFNLDQTSYAIESMKTTMGTVSAMKEGAKQMKKEFKALDIDKIEDVQDDLAELMFDVQEVDEVMGRAWGVPDDVDEADLDDELAALDDEILNELEDEQHEESVPDYLKASEMPSAPSGTPAAKVSTTAAPVKQVS